MFRPYYRPLIRFAGSVQLSESCEGVRIGRSKIAGGGPGEAAAPARVEENLDFFIFVVISFAFITGLIGIVIVTVFVIGIVIFTGRLNCYHYCSPNHCHYHISSHSISIY